MIAKPKDYDKMSKEDLAEAYKRILIEMSDCIRLKSIGEINMVNYQRLTEEKDKIKKALDNKIVGTI